MQVTLTIPNNAELVVERGVNIQQGEPWYRIPQKKDIVVNVAQKFKIRPDAIFNYLTKVVGEEIKQQDLLALKKSLFSTKRILSDHDGIIKNINHQTGEITLQIDKNDRATVAAYFNGLVKGIDGKRVTVTIEKGESFVLKECQTDWGGECFYFNEPELYFKLSEEDMKNKAVIIETLKPHIAVKCEALGALGFACCQKDYRPDRPHAIFQKIDDYKRLLHLKKKNILFATLDRLAVAYD